MNTQLSQKEQELLVLEIVDACIQYSEEKQMDFADALGQIFADRPEAGFSNMVYKTMESLCKRGYITGTVNLACAPIYEADKNNKLVEADTSEEISFLHTELANIGISAKGRLFMGEDAFKALGGIFEEKAKSLLEMLNSDKAKDIGKDVIIAIIKFVVSSI